MRQQLFHLVLIKPTHYDDSGYPIQWVRSIIPANTLACLAGLAKDAERRKVLGPDVDIRLHLYNDTNRRIRPAALVKTIRKTGGKGLICFVGVQSNQFPRAIDLARPFLAASLPVCMGGFHVSGCLAMLPEMPPEMRAAQAMGISFFAGEAEEGRFDRVLLDASKGKLEQLYDYLGKLPNLQGEPLPILAREDVRCCDSKLSTMDLGRGCPYQCSFCTIINVHGQKSRFRSPDDLEEIIRQNHAQNLRRFFITDDNFARNRNWELLFDRLIELRWGEFWGISFIIQVDAQCHKIPNFIEKAARAGVIQVFIGLENINPDNLITAKKRQNKITEYRQMLRKWREHGVITLAGYIIGFPADNKSSILRDIEIIKRELSIDILDLVCLTPLPGSEDHKILWQNGTWMDPDLNKYDTHHRVTHHPKMSDAEWEGAYHAATETYYTPEHIRTVLRRAACSKLGRPRAVLNMLLWFKLSAIEGVHPLDFGAIRLKWRRDRRSDLPRESPFLFYPRLVGENVVKFFRYLRVALQAQSILKEVLASSDRWTYSDTAIAGPDSNEFEVLDLYQATGGGKAAVERKHRGDAIRTGAHAEI